nr:Chain A, p9-1 [Rice black-streaked dwarf virus 2]5EFT_C Chain C, p9-1 [Rice black-streaked dwarf virus 2]5EFT_E Chain E, p9-1 [Rice black-streaked dwarf virus 2]5EFT_G Chain G, p9-1 [Rice black-streaked dwarf virus 2]
ADSVIKSDFSSLKLDV